MKRATKSQRKANALAEIEREFLILEEAFMEVPEDDYENEAKIIERRVKNIRKEGLINENEERGYISRLKRINT